LGIQYKMTTYQNITLNNYVDCSNNNLRNALISLGIFFSLICISFTMANFSPNQLDQQSEILTEQTEQMTNLQKEINILQEEISDFKSSNEDDIEKLNSNIDKLNSLSEKNLNDEN